ncbi:MAG: DUF262 domain-containing HNH endonuclease family protein [Bacteroidota bacterium]|uniref:DUF262 domain-containing protein n=1 Tax=Runella sp. TaxID=1960881 RepID=UPI003018BB92
MRVEPEYGAVGTFFQNQPIFRIPKYQRGYAWDKDEIEDFLRDLEKVFNARKDGQPKGHFMGGIVSVEHKLSGGVSRHWHELVDGQQRLATFILLATAILRNYEKITVESGKLGDATNQKIAEKRSVKIKARFIEFEQEINRVTSIQKVMELTKSDDLYFSSLIHNQSFTPAPTLRDSHKRLKYAYDQILKTVTLLSSDTNVITYLDHLEILEQNIDEDFSMLRIVTYDQKEAYTLFQVLNDRGKSLTEGDLLRAKTLELLEGHIGQQNAVESLWDGILADSPRETEEYLRWIFASYQGIRPGTSTLFDQFLKAFYPQNTLTLVSTSDADNILLNTQEVNREIINCRKLTNGEWIFPFGQPITAWDRNRLSLLINELKNKNSMPLLMAAAKLDHKKFAEVVSVMERFMFRYVIVCKQHHDPVLDLVQNEAMAIRRNPSGYTLANLKTKLQELLDKKADDTFFKTSLDSLRYKENNGSNKSLKYFLITIEDYLRWYRNGAVGQPECLDKSRLFTFADTTIEHIYPRNASGAVYDGGMDDLKNTIGNLTIMGPSDNGTVGNDAFLSKRPIYKQSTPTMNHEIANLTQWDRSSLLLRSTELKEIAAKVFKIK